MDLKLFALHGTQVFGAEVATALGLTLAAHEEREFEDGEHKIRSLENVRGRDVYVLHSLYGDSTQSPNDKLIRLLFFAGALRDASAARVTAVVPYLCYMRKDRRTKSRDPVSSRYIAQLMEAVGIERVVTLDVHNVAAYQNAFRIPAEHLEAAGLFASELVDLVGTDAAVVVAPDAGAAKRAEALRERLEQVLGRPVERALMEKRRSSGVVSGDQLAGDVAGRSAVIVDDLISSGTTLARAARACREHGARRVYAAVTHSLFSTRGSAQPADLAVDVLLISDTIPLTCATAGSSKRQVVRAAPLFAAAIDQLHREGSIVELLATR
jgi:ribose-phosphate pyrophosphokinase